VIGPTPLLDLFRRGDLARDVRLLAAQGTLAPRAHEQLSILILLLNDPDREIRAVAGQTLDRIPEETLKGFLARSDVSADVREFLADRNVIPAEMPLVEVDDPLIDTDLEDPDLAAADTVEGGREAVDQRIAKMSFPQRLKAAVKGTREMRAILVRDPNKMISAGVLSSPKLTENEVESFARMANVSEDVLRIIGSNRAWMKNYGVVVGLTSLLGVLRHRRAGHVRLDAALTIGPMAIVGALLGSVAVLRVSGRLQLTAFAIVMLLAAVFMLRPQGDRVPTSGRRRPLPLLAALGLGVGFLTGFLGVGGGFLYVPALALLLSCPSFHPPA